MCFPGNRFLEPFTSRSPPPVSCALLGPSHLALLSHHGLSGGSLLKSENNCFCDLAALLDGLSGVKDWKNYRAIFLSLSRWDISAWGWEVQSCWKFCQPNQPTARFQFWTRYFSFPPSFVESSEPWCGFKPHISKSGRSVFPTLGAVQDLLILNQASLVFTGSSWGGIRCDKPVWY